MSILPGLTQFRGYQRDWLRGDVAGLTVAAYLVPQVMAYATVAGMPPVVGLWAALIPLAVYAVLGSSRRLSVGPESTTALMTAAAAVALLVGAICFIGGIVRLGMLADLLSRPVLVGYMTGVAVIMIGGQLGKVTGISVKGDEFVDQVRSFAAGLSDVHWPTVALSAAVLVVLLILGRLVPRLPGPLIAILLATVAVAVFSLHRNGIEVVGDIPGSLPPPGLPGIPAADVATLLVPAAGIAIVAFSDNVLTARTLPQGTASVSTRTPNCGRSASAIWEPVYCTLSGELQRQSHRAGRSARQPYPDVLGGHPGVRARGDAGRTGVLSNFPMAALVALVVYAAMRLVDVPEFQRLARFRRSELVLALATTASVLLFGVLYGAIVLSILDLLRRVARPHDAIQGFVPGVAGMHDCRRLSGSRVRAGSGGVSLRRPVVLRQRRELP